MEIKKDARDPRDMRILVTRIHFTQAGTYQYRKLKIHISRGPIVYMQKIQVTQYAMDTKFA